MYTRTYNNLNPISDAFVSFLNGPSPAYFSFIFVFPNKHYNFYKKYVKNVRPVSGAVIQTHNLQNPSLLP